MRGFENWGNNRRRVWARLLFGVLGLWIALAIFALLSDGTW